MRTVFTDYLRQTRDGSQASSEEAFEGCYEALAQALRNELSRRGLWNLPPRYLGVDGSAHWLEGATAGATTGATTAFDELVADCIVYVFIDRAQSLMAHLETKANLEGLVVRNIRNFIFERQRHHDPVGFRTYDLVRRVVTEALRTGLLAGDAASARLKSSAVLHLRESEGPDEAAALNEESIEPFARVVFEQLFKPTSEQLARCTSALVDLISPCSQDGVGSFRLGELVDRTKPLVRAQWAAVTRRELEGQGSEFDSAGHSRRVHVDPTPVATALELTQLERCVSKLAAGLELDVRSLHYLRALWRYFLAQASEHGRASLPSARAVARDTGVPRERVPPLKRRLGELVRRCLSGQSATAAVSQRVR